MALNTNQLQALKAELFTDDTGPLWASYQAIEAGGGDQVSRDTALADLINSLGTNRTVIRESMSGRDLFEATDQAEYGALGDSQKLQWLTLSSFDAVDPAPGGNAEALTLALFGGGSTTVATLATRRQQTVSRATELGLPEVKAADVGEARNA